MAIKTVYKTSDGREFASLEHAQAHQNSIDLDIQKLKTEVIEDLNKILIKLKNTGLDDFLYLTSSSADAENESTSALESTSVLIILISNFQLG